MDEVEIWRGLINYQHGLMVDSFSSGFGCISSSLNMILGSTGAFLHQTDSDPYGTCTADG